jgi:hypothetical protein
MASDYNSSDGLKLNETFLESLSSFYVPMVK